MSPAQDLQVRETSQELAVRSARARTGLECVRSILGPAVTAEALIETSRDQSETHATRLVAKRALRFLVSLSRPDSRLARVLETDEDLYAGAEAVLLFGASDDRYVDLMESGKLTAEQATGVFALREEISDYFDKGAAIDSVVLALGRVGIDPRKAYEDVEGALSAIHERGLVDGRLPFLNAFQSAPRILEYDPDEDMARNEDLIHLLSRNFTTDPM